MLCHCPAAPLLSQAPGTRHTHLRWLCRDSSWALKPAERGRSPTDGVTNSNSKAQLEEGSTTPTHLAIPANLGASRHFLLLTFAVFGKSEHSCSMLCCPCGKTQPPFLSMANPQPISSAPETPVEFVFLQGIQIK